jgi:hypothetical protein
VQAEVSAAAATVAALSGERDSHRTAAEEAVQRANVSAIIGVPPCERSLPQSPTMRVLSLGGQCHCGRGEHVYMLFLLSHVYV